MRTTRVKINDPFEGRVTSTPHQYHSSSILIIFFSFVAGKSHESTPLSSRTRFKSQPRSDISNLLLVRHAEVSRDDRVGTRKTPLSSERLSSGSRVFREIYPRGFVKLPRSNKSFSCQRAARNSLTLFGNASTSLTSRRKKEKEELLHPSNASVTSDIGVIPVLSNCHQRVTAEVTLFGLSPNGKWPVREATVRRTRS